MQQSITSILSTTELFDNLTETQLELVTSICEAETYQAGDILLEEQDCSDDMYVIARGIVEVVINPAFVGDEIDQGHVEPVALTELRQGQVFGEVSLVDQGIRSASIRIIQENTLLLRIPRDRIMLLCESYPEFGYKLMKNIAADLAFKIRNTDLTIRQYQLLLFQSKRNAA